jgi:hypothetical protein
MADAFTPATFADTLPSQQTNFAYHDPAQWLPPAAAERLRRLQQHVEDRRTLCPDFDQRKDSNDEKRAAERRLQQLVAHPQEAGFGLPDDHPSVVVARRQAEQATAAAKRLDDLYKVRSAELRAASAVLSNVTLWLRDGRPAGTVLEAVEIEPPKLNDKNETIPDAVERLRRRGRELKADMHRVASSPYPSKYCREKATAEIEALAQRGAPSVSQLVEHDGGIEFPTQPQTAQVWGADQPSLAFSEPVDALALFAWTFKEVLISKLAAEIDGEADDAAALSHEAREKAEAELMADLLDIERQEAALVWRAEGLEHRSDISPIALLGLRLVTAPRALPGTSPSMAVDYVGPG